MNRFEALGDVNVAGIPEMNLDSEGKSFRAVEEELNEPAHVASALGHFVSTESDIVDDAGGSGIVLNLDECLITSKEALKILTVVAHHSPAYGSKLEEADAKALDTFYSMHGGSSENDDAQGCTWYGSVDSAKLPNIFPKYFDDDESGWKNWIGFFVVCVRADKRTVSYVLGADTD